MLKRISCIILIATLLIGTICVPTNAAETSADTEITRQEGLLSALKIVNAGSTDQTAKISRAEFAEYLWNCLKLQELDNPRILFNDVSEDSHITDLATYGYFVGNGGAFEPDREMTINEAYIVAARVTGHDVLANLDGGTVSAYSRVAMRAGITTGVSETEGLTFRNAAVILYNMLTVPIYEIESLSDNGIIYGDKKGNTLLELLYGIKIVKGIVTANCYASIYQDISKTDKNSIRIEKIEYECNIMNADKLIGRYVTAYYNDETGKKEIVYVHTDDEKDDAVKIDARDFVNYSGNTISYYKNGRVNSVTLEGDAVFIHNGQDLMLYTKMEKLETLKMNYGSISLYKSGKSLYYTVIINEIKTAVVSSVDEKKEVVYAENIDGSTVNFNKKTADFFRVYNAKTNTELGLSALNKGNLISYAMSSDGKVAEIFLCSGSVSGIVSMISDIEGEKVLTINENKYIVNKDFVPMADLKIGITTTYLLDMFGNIAYEEDGKRSGGGTIAYFYDAAQIDEAFDSQVKLKVYDKDGKHKVLTVAKKCKIDGVGGKAPAEIFTALTDGTGKAVRQVVIYKIDGEGFVNAIDTAASNEDSRENKQTLWLMAPAAKRTLSRDGSSKVYMYAALNNDTDPLGYPIDNDTTVLITPDLKTDINSETEMIFGIGNITNIEATGLNVEIYKYDDANPFADLVVVMDDEALSRMKLTEASWLINDICMKLSANNTDMVTSMNLLTDMQHGYTREILIHDYVYLEFSKNNVLKVAWDDVEQYISSGDIIQIGKVISNEIGENVCTHMRLLYDYSADKTYWATEEEPHKYESQTYDEWRSSRHRFTFGYVDYLYIEQDMLYPSGSEERNNVMSVFTVSDNDHNVKDMYVWNTAYNRFATFDDSRRQYEKAYSAVIGDIVDYQTGKENASRVFVRWHEERPQGIIFYK
ncbi:MAG: hypothetical protein IKW64_06565 [Clostridia bacterium]|nr:hypothetical protein [Clostridia bacterium]